VKFFDFYIFSQFCSLVIFKVWNISVVDTIFDTQSEEAYRVVKDDSPIPGGPASKIRKGLTFQCAL